MKNISRFTLHNFCLKLSHATCLQLELYCVNQAHNSRQLRQVVCLCFRIETNYCVAKLSPVVKLPKKSKQVENRTLSKFLKVKSRTSNKEKRHTLNLQTSTCPCLCYFAAKVWKAKCRYLVMWTSDGNRL
jgi:hypothetical protein